jgi:uncharacterized protein (DUF983 family)
LQAGGRHQKAASGRGPRVAHASSSLVLIDRSAERRRPASATTARTAPDRQPVAPTAQDEQPAAIIDASRVAQTNVVCHEQAKEALLVTSFHTSPSPGSVGMRGCCPRCGRGKLFEKVLMVRARCDACGLDYRFADAGDGPAIFAIFILGFLVLGGALIAEFKFGATFWFHVVAWGVLTPLLAVGLLRFLKGLLISQQFRTKAEQGRLDA